MSGDPVRDAFNARRTGVASAVDANAGLADLERRHVAAQRRRGISAVALVLVALGIGGAALLDRTASGPDRQEVATAPAPSTAAPSGTIGGSSAASTTSVVQTSTSPELSPSTSISTATTPPTTSAPPTTTTSAPLAADPGPPLIPVPIIASGSTLADFPCVLDDETLVAASNLETNGPYAAPLGPPSGDEVIDITRESGERCERTVITLDGDGFAPGTTASGTSTGIRIDLPGITFARKAELFEASTFVGRDTDTGDLYVDIFASPGASIVSFGDSPARVVVDHRPEPAPVLNPSVPNDVLGPVVVTTFFAPGQPSNEVRMPASIIGLARPFEARMEVAVIDGTGAPATASWDGGINGPATAVSYIVATSDWVSAWGEFAVSLDGLDPGAYTLRFLVDDGNTSAEYDVPFVVTA